MRIRGHGTAYVRPPLTRLSEEHREVLEAELNRLADEDLEAEMEALER